MGVYVRYNWNESFIKSMVTRIKQDIEDVSGVGHLQAINNQGLKDQVHSPHMTKNILVRSQAVQIYHTKWWKGLSLKMHMMLMNAVK